MVRSIFSLVVLVACCSVSAKSDIELSPGAGSFVIAGGLGAEKKAIDVHYYRPAAFTASSDIVIVLPGGGRNGDDYRDKWVKSAEKYNLLILSPSYSKKDYPGPNNYNLGRSIRWSDSRFYNPMQIRKNMTEWIYRDFDRLFLAVKESVQSKKTYYDLFGHSAGGQIAHRMALFYPQNRARHIVAANAGWYTEANWESSFPYGLKESPLEAKGMDKAFKNKLVVFLGEKDDEHETRGHLRTTEEANLQGNSRVARGHYFYHNAQQEAASRNMKFAWKLAVVPNVGHSSTKMSEAAAEYLYGDPLIFGAKYVPSDFNKNHVSR